MGAVVRGEVAYDPEVDEAVHLGDVLACDRDDPAMAAGRNLDRWLSMNSHDRRYLCIIFDTATGRIMLETARACRMPYYEMREIRDRLVEDLQEWMGPSAIADSVHVPSWRGNIMADHERVACRADRRPGLEKEGSGICSRSFSLAPGYKPAFGTVGRRNEIIASYDRCGIQFQGWLFQIIGGILYRILCSNNILCDSYRHQHFIRVTTFLVGRWCQLRIRYLYQQLHCRIRQMSHALRVHLSLDIVIFIFHFGTILAILLN